MDGDVPTAIEDADRDLALARLDPDDDRGARAAVAGRRREEVPEDVLDVRRVAVDRGRIAPPMITGTFGARLAVARSADSATRGSETGSSASSSISRSRRVNASRSSTRSYRRAASRLMSVAIWSRDGEPRRTRRARSRLPA